MSDNEWPHSFIHIVNTRFMQHQPHLPELGNARLVLFRTFCLGTILNQELLDDYDDSDGARIPFLWIIKVDPQLQESIRDSLVNMVKNYPFVYVIGSNVNYGIGIHPGGWRGGEAGSDVLNSPIYTGNRSLLKRAYLARNSRAILETRVDADDGLHSKYLKAIQDDAKNKLRWEVSSETQQNWMYWCPLNRMEWTPAPLQQSDKRKYGMFIAKRSAHACITAGITLGVSLGVEEYSIPRFMHQTIFQELRAADIKKTNHSCGGVQCLKMKTDPILGAIRSRTPTSAGMKGVAVDGNNFEEYMTKEAFNNMTVLNLLLIASFGADLHDVAFANSYLQSHFNDIVSENLKGQCTHGHSCKLSTKEALQNLLDLEGNYSRNGRLVDPVHIRLPSRQ